VRGEPERLAQALENLLTNAVRYGAQPITVTARAAGDVPSV
jgi:signal transduction histidine kinase